MTQPISTTSTHSVLQLQQYLNLLSRRYPFITPVRANGQYDQATQQAVMQFQRELHPPVTGVVDQGTWNAIQKAAKAQDLPDFAPRSLRAFPPTANVLPDTHHSYMRVPQAMFQALLPLVDGIQPDIADGIHGPASVANVRWLQRRAGLTENGIMCLQTWNALTRLYEIMITADLELLSPGRG